MPLEHLPVRKNANRATAKLTTFLSLTVLRAAKAAGGGNPADKERERFYCKKKGHVKADRRARQRDLAKADGRGDGKGSKKPLAATAVAQQQPAATAAVQPQMPQQPQQVYLAPTMPMVAGQYVPRRRNWTLPSQRDGHGAAGAGPRVLAGYAAVCER